jgi:hypothetical protein
METFNDKVPNRHHDNLDAQSMMPPSHPVPILISEHVPFGGSRMDNTPSPQIGQLTDLRSRCGSPPQNKNSFENSAPLVFEMVKACLKEVGMDQSKSDFVIQKIKIGLDRAWDKCSSTKEDASCCGEDIVEKGTQAVNKRVTRKVKRGRTPGRTMMICNIPCRARHEDLVKAIESCGFGGTFDSLHLPCRCGQSDSNLGYAFVRFLREEDAERFAIAFEGYRFNRKGSTKTCTVKVASIQGGANRRLPRNLRLAQRDCQVA